MKGMEGGEGEGGKGEEERRVLSVVVLPKWIAITKLDRAKAWSQELHPGVPHGARKQRD